MIAYRELERDHLPPVMRLCEHESWPSYTQNPEITWKALTAPGVSTIVALDRGEVIGFAQMQSDGVIQAHLSLIAVADHRRRQGIGRGLIQEAFRRSGCKRVDLLSTEDGHEFYRSFPHTVFLGYRLYPEASG